MSNDTPNPYEAPATKQQAGTFTFTSSIVAACVLWVLLSVAIWIAQSFIAPIFEDFDVELPVLTQLMTHPVFPLAPLLVAIAIAVIASNSPPRLRYYLCLLSFVLSLVLTLLVLYLWLSPLMSLMNALN